MGFKIIGRRNGKKTVSDNSENDVTKITKVLEFLIESDSSAATIGSHWSGSCGTQEPAVHYAGFKEKLQKESTLTRKQGKKNGRQIE